MAPSLVQEKRMKKLINRLFGEVSYIGEYNWPPEKDFTTMKVKSWKEYDINSLYPTTIRVMK